MSNEPSGESCITPPAARAEALDAVAREMEGLLTLAQKERAFRIMRGAGWTSANHPPTWCWIMVFSQVLGEDASERTGRTSE